MAQKARVPAYRLHNASGQGIVSLNGRTIYTGAHGTAASLAEYDRLIGEWMANGRRLPAAEYPDGPPDLTVSGLIVAYLKWADGYYVKDGAPTSEVGAINTRLFADVHSPSSIVHATPAIRHRIIKSLLHSRELPILPRASEVDSRSKRRPSTRSAAQSTRKVSCNSTRSAAPVSRAIRAPLDSIVCRPPTTHRGRDWEGTREHD